MCLNLHYCVWCHSINRQIGDKQKQKIVKHVKTFDIINPHSMFCTRSNRLLATFQWQEFKTIPSLLDPNFSNTHSMNPLPENFCIKAKGVYQENSYSGMHLIRLNCRTIGFSDGTVNNRKHFPTYDDLIQVILFCLCLIYKITVHTRDSVGINWSP